MHNGYVDKANDTASQTIGGTTAAGAQVTIYDHGTKVATVTADSAGAWSYKVGALANGSTHSYAVTATDTAGDVSAMSGALSFTVDASPPAAPTGLADAAISHGYVNAAHDTAGQTLTGTAEAGALVTVYDNGTKLGTATADASTGAWNFQLGVLADGRHDLTATATDAAGNIGRSSAGLIFKVDTQPPIPVVNAVTDAAKGMSNVNGSAEAGSTVSLFDGGKLVGVTTAGHDGKWNVTIKLNGGAVHQLTETAVDLAGNTGASTGATYWANQDQPAAGRRRGRRCADRPEGRHLDRRSGPRPFRAGRRLRQGDGHRLRFRVGPDRDQPRHGEQRRFGVGPCPRLARGHGDQLRQRRLPHAAGRAALGAARGGLPLHLRRG